MELLEKFFKKEEKKHNLGVCIPDKAKGKKAEAEEAPEGRGFAVSGVFHVHDSIMVQGTPAAGTIRVNDKLCIAGQELKVRDIQVGRKDTEAIEEGQQGALFLVSEGKAPIIKAGDLLEF